MFVRLFFIVQISYASESSDDTYDSDIDLFHIRPVASLHCQICIRKEPCVCAALFHTIRYHIYPREGEFNMTWCSPLRQVPQIICIRKLSKLRSERALYFLQRALYFSNTSLCIERALTRNSPDDMENLSERGARCHIELPLSI